MEKISLLIELESIRCNKNLIRKSLDLFKSNSISFVDAYLGAAVLSGKNDILYTFDKRLLKVLNANAVEPK